MNKPTNEELQQAIDVLTYVCDDIEQHEPYAVNAINTFNECLEIMPTSQSELSGG